MATCSRFDIFHFRGYYVEWGALLVSPLSCLAAQVPLFRFRSPRLLSLFRCRTHLPRFRDVETVWFIRDGEKVGRGVGGQRGPRPTSLFTHLWVLTIFPFLFCSGTTVPRLAGRYKAIIGRSIPFLSVHFLFYFFQFWKRDCLLVVAGCSFFCCVCFTVCCYHGCFMLSIVVLAFGWW